MLNIPAAIVAAFVTFMLGGPWYSKHLFLNAWQRGAEIPEGTPPKTPKHPAIVFGLSYAAALVSALFLSWQLGPHAGALPGLTTGAVVGGGFVAPCFAINYAFANRTLLLWSVDAGYHVVQFSLLGLILGVWP